MPERFDLDSVERRLEAATWGLVVRDTELIPDLHAACSEVRALRAALNRVYSVGHNLDCIFCGRKDLVAYRALGLPIPDEEEAQ